MQDSAPGQDELDDEDREGDEPTAAGSNQTEQLAADAPVKPALAPASVAAATVAQAGQPAEAAQETAAPQAEARPSAPEVPEAITSAPAPSAFNLPPLPPIPPAVDVAEPADTALVAADAAEEAAPEAPVVAHTPERTQESPAHDKPVEAAMAMETPASVPTEPSVASETPVPMPAQGDLLASSAPRPTVAPAIAAPEEVTKEPAPSTDDEQHPPKDAAQG